MVPARKSRHVSLTRIKNLQHRTHAATNEKMQILFDAYISYGSTEDHCGRVASSFGIRARSKALSSIKKVSFTHDNEVFNQSVQADFLILCIQEVIYFDLNIIYAGTNYMEGYPFQINLSKLSLHN